jgi:4-amino-4-deoxy-L-arabinose transferase-like glycosyltransferase
VVYNAGVGTESATVQPLAPRPRSGARTGPLVRLRDPRLALILLLSLVAGALAYQAPASAYLRVGWLGDQLFLPAGEGLGADSNGRWYGDEIDDAAGSGRSRWTRQRAEVIIPGLHAAGDLGLTIRAQGWPADALNPARQPTVTVLAGATPVGSFRPAPAYADYRLSVPAAAVGQDGTLRLSLSASGTFTDTARYTDPRPKGIRVEAISVQGGETAGPLVPPVAPVAWLMLCGGLLFLALAAPPRRQTLAFVLATLLVSGAALGLALARAWTVALLPWAALALGGALLLVHWQSVVALARQLVHQYSQGSALNYGLVAAAIAWLAYVALRAPLVLNQRTYRLLRDTFPDSLLVGALVLGALLLIIIRGRDGLPRACQAVVGFLGARRGALALLGGLGALWIGYEAYVIALLPYVGHADYADNAVVARNLLHGRGWVVDYVTQFYQLYEGVTRPQETWPLLQPVWILPFFVAFGPSAWAAKLPNLVCVVGLTLLLFAAGARLWDRRAGLVAALIILTSQWFFRLVIYTTTDLAFVLFTFGALWLLYRYVAGDGRRTTDDGPLQRRGAHHRRWSLLLGSALLTGLMLLQKPGSGALIAVGMGLWFLGEALGGARGAHGAARRLAPVVLWAAVALAILAPYLVRNMRLFGVPFYSTESRDAWVLGYGDWEDIYRVYTPEAGLSETGGLPDRSWVLRWGFDRTLRKVAIQAAAARDYLLPPWKDLPAGLDDWLFGRPGKALLFGMGAWLSLLGVVGALRARRRLLGLLLAAFLPYTLFLILYWHANEERYFVVLLPWLALFAAAALWAIYDRLAAIGDGRWAPVGLALVATALFLVIQPSWPDIAGKVRDEPQLWTADLDAYAWLRDHTEPGAVVMTRAPWQLNWHSERPAVMTPNTASRDTFLRIARYYNVRYLVLDTLSNPSEQARRVIDGMLEDPQLGFAEVYRSPEYVITDDRGRRVALSTEVYRFPPQYGDVAAVEGR